MKASNDFAGGHTSPDRTSSNASREPASESRHGAGRLESFENPANESGGVAASGSSGGLAEGLLRFIEEVTGSAEGLIEVYADRAKQSVRRTIVKAVVGGGVAVCAAIWLGSAALAVLRGVCGGFTALWGGRAWLGDLTGGLLGLTFAGAAIALCVHLSSRRELRRLEAKYERIRNKNSERHETATAADDGGGAA